VNIWFTSDEHYDHKNIIEFCNRPFASVEEMKEKMIENHNKVVRPGDLVYHLGDIFWRTLPVDNAIGIVKRLAGQQYYVFGNHDELFRNKFLREQFVWCKDTYNLKVAGYPHMWLSHYAHEDWNGSHRGSYNLFGHVHGAKPDPVGLKLDVGVDIRNFTPMNIDEVHAILGKKAETLLTKFWSCDNVECKNRFTATDEIPKTCAKCGSTMKLMKKLI
jgi:calcineurin-like phosphoesterase family protein